MLFNEKIIFFKNCKFIGTILGTKLNNIIQSIVIKGKKE